MKENLLYLCLEKEFYVIYMDKEESDIQTERK